MYATILDLYICHKFSSVHDIYATFLALYMPPSEFNICPNLSPEYTCAGVCHNLSSVHVHKPQFQLCIYSMPQSQLRSVYTTIVSQYLPQSKFYICSVALSHSIREFVICFSILQFFPWFLIRKKKEQQETTTLFQPHTCTSLFACSHQMFHILFIHNIYTYWIVDKYE